MPTDCKPIRHNAGLTGCDGETKPENRDKRPEGVRENVTPLSRRARFESLHVFYGVSSWKNLRKGLVMGKRCKHNWEFSHGPRNVKINNEILDFGFYKCTKCNCLGRVVHVGKNKGKIRKIPNC